MADIGYGICLVVSVLVILVIARKDYENIDIGYWSVLLVNPIVISGYWLQARVSSPQAAYVAVCYTYLDSTVFLTVTLFLMLRVLQIKPKGWIKVAAYTAAFLHIAMVCLCMNNTLYYKSLTVTETSWGYTDKIVGGPLKIVHFIYLGLIMTALISIVIAGYIRQGTYSRRSLNIFAVVLTAGVAIYFLESVLDTRFTVLPYFYAVSSILIARDYDFLHSHDITSIIAKQYDSSSERGYALIGLNRTFYNCNAKCREFMPFMLSQRTDAPLDPGNEHAAVILNLINDFNAGNRTSAEFTSGDKICICEISRFSVTKGGKDMGYLIAIRDATEEKHNLEILTNYNFSLSKKVEEKTQHIKDIQQTIVLGMADMIENRDSNTGGHVKRTSSTISIIVDEIKRQGNISIDSRLAEDIVRAAPMHDLGKLQIDSSILCKPGKLTAEEYEIMKSHSTKSGEMVMILLDGVEEPEFVKTSYNVARYHHERWDGKGYPEGLVGEMIPLEARIMAVADVYDALVSKRCYKDSMSFETAYSIMCENMGTQFDPNMRKVFIGCHTRLEEYYRSSEN